MPKLSIIIPVYNVENYLAQCLDSVLGQSFEDYELICVDDGSEDSSRMILEQYAQRDSRIRVLLQEHSDAGTARNRGFRESSGEFILFLDSDDIFAPRMFQALLEKMESTHADLAVCHSVNFWNEHELVFPDFVREELQWEKIETPAETVNIFNRYVGWAWDKMIRRSFIERYQLYFQEQRSTNDLFFVYSALSLAAEIVETPCVFIHHRRHSASIESSRNKSPLCFISALRQYHAFMESHHIFERAPQLQRHFYNYVLRFMFWHLDTIGEESYMVIYDHLKEMCDSFALGSYSPEYFNENHYFYERYLRIQKGHNCIGSLLLQLSDYRTWLAEQKNAACRNEQLAKSYLHKITGLEEETARLKVIEADKQALEEEFNSLKKRLDERESELRKVYRSVSFRTGRFLTYPLRKIRNTVRFWHSHGMLATLRKIKRKLLFQTETQGNGNEQ